MQKRYKLMQKEYNFMQKNMHKESGYYGLATAPALFIEKS